MDDLLSEVGCRTSGRCSDAKDRGDDAEEFTAPGPDSVEGAINETGTEIETMTDARGESIQRGGTRNGRGCLRLVPRIQSKVARLLHAYNGKCLGRHPCEQEGSIAKQAYVCFQGAGKKGAMVFVERQEWMHLDTMEASL